MALTKKRRKKGHYKTGIHNSPKCKKPIEYRSGWEFEVAKYLDLDENVIEYDYECVAIPYLMPSKKSMPKVHSYYPDFLVTYKDGTRKLVEVKRKDKLNNSKVVKKAEAAIAWCRKQKPTVIYEFWTDTMIEAFTKINEAANPTAKPVIPPSLTKQVQGLVKKRRSSPKSPKIPS
jgi:hypothetical protein